VPRIARPGRLSNQCLVDGPRRIAGGSPENSEYRCVEAIFGVAFTGSVSGRRHRHAVRGNHARTSSQRAELVAVDENKLSAAELDRLPVGRADMALHATSRLMPLLYWGTTGKPVGWKAAIEHRHRRCFLIRNVWRSSACSTPAATAPRSTKGVRLTECLFGVHFRSRSRITPDPPSRALFVRPRPGPPPAAGCMRSTRWRSLAIGNAYGGAVQQRPCSPWTVTAAPANRSCIAKSRTTTELGVINADLRMTIFPAIRSGGSLHGRVSRRDDPAQA